MILDTDDNKSILTDEEREALHNQMSDIKVPLKLKFGFLLIKNKQTFKRDITHEQFNTYVKKIVEYADWTIEVLGSNYYKINDYKKAESHRFDGYARLIVERDGDQINVKTFYDGFGIFTDFGLTNRIITKFMICLDCLISEDLK
ncbi:MAG: hypothetical protein N4A72_06535 [Bacteroidales bacterium]|jgi:hypothetical protein|nr:hypothetical protein [Bacteroidales bacterium]